MLSTVLAGGVLAVSLGISSVGGTYAPCQNGGIVITDSTQIGIVSSLLKDGVGVATPLMQSGAVDEEEISQAGVGSVGVSFKKKKVLTRQEKLEIKRRREERERRRRIEEAKKAAWGREKAYCEAYEENVLDGVANCNSDCISFMSYHKVTSTTSDQYKLLYGDKAHTDPDTGLRMVGDRYCIALGSGYTSKIGTKVDLVMKNGSILKCILGDQKSDRGTDKETHTFHQFYDGTDEPGDGSVAEMIMDDQVFRGVSSYPKSFDGRILKVVVFPEDFFDKD